MVAVPHGDGPTAAVVIRVTRSGGVAGIRRTWSVESAESDGWAPLVDGCPWSDEPKSYEPESHGPDRFVWFIEVRAPEPARAAQLPDAAVQGPWRRLVDRVREQGDAVRPTVPPIGEVADE